VAATEKDAVWPAVTVWLDGCAVIEGLTGVELWLVEANPAHPAFANADSIANKISAPRFIVRLTHGNCSRRDSLVGKGILSQKTAPPTRPLRAGSYEGRYIGSLPTTTARKAKNGAVRFLPRRVVGRSPTRITIERSSAR